LATASSLKAEVFLKRLQVEFYGGIAAIAPDDLNSVPEYYKAYYQFYYIDRYDYYRKVGYIQDFQTQEEGSLRILRVGVPFGVRVRYRVAAFLDLSLGVRGFLGSAASTYSIDVHLIDRDGVPSGFRRVYDPLQISVSGITPLFGLHFRRKLAAGLGLEAFLAGGPLFGSVRQSRQARTEVSGTTSESFMEQDGTGSGIALEGGLRLETELGRKLVLFIETGYAYQKAGGFEGKGFLRSAAGEESWEGEWAMKDGYLADYWGTRDIVWATNSWSAEEEPLRRRDFKLDLSGVQVRVGVAFRL
jgi:hypothetical protein